MPPEISISTRSGTNLSIFRHVRAARRRVYSAFTDPRQVRDWYWYLDKPMAACEIDFRPGGSWRFLWQGDGGAAIGCSGDYLEVAVPDRFVQTERWDDDWTGGSAVVTTVFSDAGHGTDVNISMEYESAESRDAMLKSNIRVLLQGAFHRLDLYLADHPA